MIGCLRTCVRKQPIIVLYFEHETVLKFYNLEARASDKSVIKKYFSHFSTKTYFVGTLKDHLNEMVLSSILN